MRASGRCVRIVLFDGDDRGFIEAAIKVPLETECSLYEKILGIGRYWHLAGFGKRSSKHCTFIVCRVSGYINLLRRRGDWDMEDNRSREASS